MQIPQKVFGEVPGKDLGNFLQILYRQMIVTQVVEESNSLPVFQKTKATKKLSTHKKEKVTKTSNRGKVKKKDNYQRNNEVERMISERNKRCMVSKNYK